MKNIFKLLSLALVGSTLFVGCQKEKAGSISFSFEDIDSPKSYIYNNYNCWQTGESIFINGSSNSVNIINGNNTVSNVPNYSVANGTPLFCFYGGTQNPFTEYDASTHTYTFDVPMNMNYASVANGKQKTDAPVAGYAIYNANGITRVSMKNLGSMFKFNFQNNSPSAVTFTSIEVWSGETANGGEAIPISGTAIVTVPSAGTPTAYTFDTNEALYVARYLDFGSGYTLAASDSNKIYFPIASVTGANLGLGILFNWHGSPFLLRYNNPETAITLGRNQIMPLGKISFNYTSQGTGNDDVHYNVQVGTTTLSLKKDESHVEKDHWELLRQNF